MKASQQLLGLDRAQLGCLTSKESRSNVPYAFLGLLVLLVWFSGGITGWPAEQPAERPATESLSRALDQEGIPGLLVFAKSQGVAAPRIHSDYWVKRLAKRDPEKAAIEQAQRDFGRKLAIALEAEAQRLQQAAASEERARSAQRLIELSDWLKAAPSYGNCFLVCRCQELALVPMGYLIADLNFPIERIETLLKRLISIEDLGSMSIEALDQEAPDRWFKQAKWSERDEQILLPWSKAYQKLVGWEKAHDMPPKPNGQERRNRLPEELAFYCDDDLFGNSTLVTQWDLKMHYALAVGGIIGFNRENVEAFFLFRQKVGKFPTKPGYTKEEIDAVEREIAEFAKRGITTVRTRYDSEIQEAFAYAWRPYKDPQHRGCWLMAAQVYEAVMSNKWFDYETQMNIGKAPKPPQTAVPPK
jgi:hypothetical protein